MYDFYSAPTRRPPRPVTPKPVPSERPKGDGWTPRNTVWAITAIAGVLGVPLIVSALIVPAVQGPKADASEVKAQATTDRELARRVEWLEGDVAETKRKAGPGFDKATACESQLAGVLARLDALEKRRPIPRRPVAPAPTGTVPAPGSVP